ncbi:NAD(P)/FAD-dependent oxidoreductase [Conexibacter sp. CPCC 206217]|uniref:NAD(P)/FAD-dependent oxidoreductase n=1 Tax=Conexibacter sp. CPCC 206217 TaxID=3064574 RepID=UPI00271A452A|nr:FAD-dependent oxidoreductase [Conexibacter sp. CPCC 206217]MDO8210916.1 FAD-dependent oxidoreductase [Conexibacter sp. CPCC 206217]
MADRHVAHLLIGGGLASASCARWLREGGAEGDILLVGREPDLPYERPPLSKEYLAGSSAREDAFYRPLSWYEEQRIEVLQRTSVMKLDVEAREARLSTKEVVSFDTALVATGANVRRLPVDGAQLEGISYLRAFGNAEQIRAEAAGRRVVLIGGSYIGCEVAATLTQLGAQCTIVMQEDVALSRTFGLDAGRFFQSRLEEHGIRLVAGVSLERFEGDGEQVQRVVTSSGEVLDADAVVIGAGVAPDVMLARSAGLALDEELGGIACDERLRTSARGIWAAGDVAAYDSVVNGRRVRAEHWDVALQHGKTVARSMLGEDVVHDVVPYFFSDLADWASLEYVGPARRWDREVVRGSFESGEFSVWYVDEGRVEGALSVGRSDDLDHARRLIASREALDDVSVARLGDAATDLAQIGAR